MERNGNTKKKQEKYKDIINRALNKIEELQKEKLTIMDKDFIVIIDILREANNNEDN